MGTNRYPSTRTVELPQYSASTLVFERFLDAAHDPKAGIVREKRNSGMQFITGSERDADALEWFMAHEKKYKDEFYKSACEQLSERTTDRFIKLISNEWYDGREARQKGSILDLKRSIREYLQVTSGANFSIASVVGVPDIEDGDTVFSAGDISRFLGLNAQMLLVAFDDWIESRSNVPDLSRSDIYLRRGLLLDQPLAEEVLYCERDYISSYSISVTIAEKFSQWEFGEHKPAILNTDLDYFNNHVLFFSPFIPGMNSEQLEFGIIPRRRRDLLTYQGSHAGIDEYFLGDHHSFMKLK